MRDIQSMLCFLWEYLDYRSWCVYFPTHSSSREEYIRAIALWVGVGIFLGQIPRSQIHTWKKDLRVKCALTTFAVLHVKYVHLQPCRFACQRLVPTNDSMLLECSWLLLCMRICEQVLCDRDWCSFQCYMYEFDQKS